MATGSDEEGGGEIATNSTGCSATSAFRASSPLRDEVTPLGSPAAIIVELKMSAPPPPPTAVAAKPPGLLVKVKTGRGSQASTVNAAAAIVGLPCRFTLRGKRQTQGRRHNNSSNSNDDDRRATMAYTSSPRRRPLLRRVVIGTKPGNAVGYSPRLRNMETGFSTEGGADTTIDFFVEPSPRTPLQGVASSGAAASTPPLAAGPFRLTPRAHRAKITPCGGCFHIDDAGAVAKSNNGHNADSGGGKARTHEAPPIGHILTQEHRLCGRLRKGTTAASPKKLVVSRHDRGGTGGENTITPGPPRTLFLVSGQAQKLPVDATGARRFSTAANMAALQRRSQIRRCERSRVSPASSLASTTWGRATTVPSGGVRRSRSGEWNWNRVRASGDEDNGSREGDEEVLLPESTSGPVDEELCTAASAEATVGGGVVGSGKRVLHVRVPRPPPTSRLLLRSAPPRTSVLRSKLL